MLTHLAATVYVGAIHPLLAAAGELVGKAAEIGKEGGRSIALGVGAGGGAAGAGAGIGMLFGKVIESVARQPEMRDEITSIQWLGFALTEATFFYGLVGGFIAFFL
jgi:F-type H+-transporting ATPase subunit c